MYILNAEEYRPEELFIEKAKMYWARGQHEHAFTTLRRGLEEAYPLIDQLKQEQRYNILSVIVHYWSDQEIRLVFLKPNYRRD